MINTEGTKVWAHRGASGYAPENTLEAFKKAEKMKARPNKQASIFSSSSWTGKLPVSKREEEAESKKSRSERPFMNSSRSDKSEARPR